MAAQLALAEIYFICPHKNSGNFHTRSTLVDLDNQLQPLLIDFVKAHLLFDAAAQEKDPNQSAIKMQSGQVFLNNFKEGLIRYGSKKRDKTGGTRAILPFSFK